VYARYRIASVAEQQYATGSGAPRAATVDRYRGGIPSSPMYLSGFRDAGN